jgi:hypothetical protein
MNNSEEAQDNPDGKEVEVFKRVNRLKLKAGGGLNDGPGQIDKSAVDRANSVVQTMASLYPREIKNVLAALDKQWEQIKDLPEGHEKRPKLAEKISNTANQIKDLAGTFGYTLMEYFGESLRDYILDTDLTKKQHFVIVQAHIDVMGVAFREGLKDDDGGPVAEELKMMVNAAIDKYR